MKRTFFELPLTASQMEVLVKGLESRFHWGLKISIDNKQTLTIEMSTMGRSLYPNESSEAHPFKLGEEVTIDSIRWENISCYVNGFFAAIKG